MATTDKLECPSEAADSSETMKNYPTSGSHANVLDTFISVVASTRIPYRSTSPVTSVNETRLQTHLCR
ncbi:hypothetical protein NPIL_560401 [Nephila pilipes]|uniref:Uncharacterized protein n=1 Tax=Nephila pilipes TaxID=299642 RepID=A0A8X6NXD2_NEPPI|nr:hypothetical protein NPIL_560401 [Nephila pilipes]